MNQPPLPPPPPASERPPHHTAAPARQRSWWPWILGGCLGVVLLIVLALGLLGWFGLRMADSAMTEAVSRIPGVREHFGDVSDVSMDWQAMKTRGGQAMVLDIQGSLGNGELRIDVDPQSKQIRGASLLLPDGRTLGISEEQLRQLEDLQKGLPPI